MGATSGNKLRVKAAENAKDGQGQNDPLVLIEDGHGNRGDLGFVFSEVRGKPLCADSLQPLLQHAARSDRIKAPGHRFPAHHCKAVVTGHVRQEKLALRGCRHRQFSADIDAEPDRPARVGRGDADRPEAPQAAGHDGFVQGAADRLDHGPGQRWQRADLERKLAQFLKPLTQGEPAPARADQQPRVFKRQQKTVRGCGAHGKTLRDHPCGDLGLLFREQIQDLQRLDQRSVQCGRHAPSGPVRDVGGTPATQAQSHKSRYTALHTRFESFTL